MSYSPKPVYFPAHSYRDGEYLAIIGGCLDTLAQSPSTQAFRLDLSVSWPASAPVYSKLPDSPPSFGAPSAITNDGQIVLVTNETVYTLSPTSTSPSWRSVMTNTNIGSNQSIHNGTLGLSAVTNPSTSEIFLPGGYLPEKMAVINLAKKTVTPAPMLPTIRTLYAVDWNAALNGFVMLDSVGGLFFYTASQWTAVAPTKGVTPSLRSSACMVAAGNDEMILFGGYSRFSSSTFNDLYILNTTSRSWRAGANVTIENGRNQVACAYSNGYLVIWGGVNTGASTEIMADITPLLYDFKADKWVTSYIAPQVPTSAQTNPTNTNPGSSNPTNTPSPSNGGGNTSMVAGVVGGLVVLLALGGLIFFRRRRRQSVTGVQRINSSSGLDLNPMYPKNIDCSQKSTIETEVGFASQIPHSNPVVRGPQTQTSDSVYYKDEYSPTNTFSQLSQSTPRSPEDNLERSQSSVSGSTAVSSHGNPQSLETPQSNGFNCPVSYPRPPQYGKYKSGVDTYSVVTQPPRQPQQPQQLQQYQQHHEPQQYHEFQRFQPQQSQQPQQSRDTRYNNLNANSYPDNTYSSYHA